MKLLIAAAAAASALALAAPASASVYVNLSYALLDDSDFSLNAVGGRVGWRSSGPRPRRRGRRRVRRQGRPPVRDQRQAQQRVRRLRDRVGQDHRRLRRLRPGRLWDHEPQGFRSRPSRRSATPSTAGTTALPASVDDHADRRRARGLHPDHVHRPRHQRRQRLGHRLGPPLQIGGLAIGTVRSGRSAPSPIPARSIRAATAETARAQAPRPPARA